MNKKIIALIVITILFSSFSPNISGSQHNDDKKTEINRTDSCDVQEDVVITCYSLGVYEQSTKEIKVPYCEVEELFDKISEYSIEIARDPQSEETQQLQKEIINLANDNNLLSSSISIESFQSNIKPFFNAKSSNGILFSTLQNKASAFFCNFATTGTGSQFPIIILPRLIPILLIPIPRVFLRWSATEGITSCGGLLSGKGFIAYGQQKGLALGFWGIGFSVFLPPIMQYGFIGYALYARADAEVIELWPPNSLPTISQINPGDGEIDVSLSLSELQFHISDFDGDLMSYTVTTSPDIGSGSGNLKPDGVYSVPVSGLEDLTEYSWHIEVTDGKDTITNDFSFTTEAVAPIVSGSFPKDGSRHASIDLDHLSFHLKDFQGDLMDYTVETSPDIGSGGEDGVGDGIYTIPINGLDFDTEYSWYVNVTDGTHWTYKVFHFKTRLAPGPWWDDSWSYRKYLGVMDASSDCQIVLKVWKEDGYDNPESDNIDCENHCDENFSDIRFVTFDGIECEYWIEETGIDGGDHYAIIWVKTPSSDDEELYLYYGNPDASDESSGDDTFIRFDDFDDYDIDEIPKASRGWSTSYENGVNWWKATTNPDGTGLVMQGHSSSSDWNNQAIYQINFAEKGRYAVHYKLYKDNGYTWLTTVYSSFREDDVGITTFHYDNSPWRIDWYDGYTYLPFNPNLSPKNGWANEEERLIFPGASLVHDGVEGIGGCRNEPIVGVNSWLIYLFRKETHDMFLDDFFIRKFISPEPMWESFGPEESSP